GEDRRRSLVDGAVGRGDERVRGRDHLVAGRDPGAMAEKMEAGGAARDGGRVRCPDRLREELLETVDRRPQRQAAGAHDPERALLLALGEPRRRQADLARDRSHALARTSTWSSQLLQVSSSPLTVAR